MFVQSSTKNPQTLNKLACLYELRQNKARKLFQLQQRAVADAQAKVDQREHDQQLVDAEVQSLTIAAASKELESNLRAQQQIQVKRHWLKYDAQKTEYFLNDALNDLETETNEANRLRSQWIQLRQRYEQFQDQHRVAINNYRLSQIMLEEREQEDEAHGRDTGAPHPG